jgi:2-dehydropantoate 2-reductase
MKILIYGGGAVGLGIASCLIKSGEKTDIIAREDTVTALRKNGLKRNGVFGEFLAQPGSFNSYSSLQNLPQTGYDFILVCTKSHGTKAAARNIQSYKGILKEDGKLVLFQNGWGNAEIFTSYFPKDMIYNARVITGFCRPEKNQVKITVHADAIHIGSLFNVVPSDFLDLSRSISNGGIPCQVVDDIGKDLWAKMLYNCALNPLGSLFKVPYGVLGEWEYTRKIMTKIVEEVFEVMEKSGYSTHWESPNTYLATFYEQLLPSTAGHESSMLQDIHLRKKTEVEALNGVVLKLGKGIKCKTPCNFMIYNMVKFMEEKAIKE